MSKPLNPKQLKFVERYLVTRNGAQSYIDAYPGCGQKTAEANASRLLRDARVQQLLAPAKEAAEVARVEQVRGIEITRDRIRLEMARLAFADPRKLFDAAGRPRPIAELDADTAAAVAQFEVEEWRPPGSETTVVTTKVKFADKNRALSNLADTEPGVWTADAKGKGDTTNNVTVNLVNLSDGDLDQLDALLDRAALPAGAAAPALAGAGEGGEGPPAPR